MRGTEHRIAGFSVVLGLCTIVCCGQATADGWRVTVRGGAVDLGETPIVTEVNDEFSPGVYQLEPASGGEGMPAQVFQDGARRLLAFILPPLAAGRTAIYSLERRRIQDSDYSRGIWFRPRRDSVEVLLDQDNFAGYRVDSGTKPIIHPLVGPTNDPYTRAYPMYLVPGEDHDHPHQRSCWFTHGKVNGIDFWSEVGKCGSIKQTSRQVTVEGLVLARLATKNDWLGPDGKVVCRDDRTVTFYRTHDSRVIDFEFTIHASDGPVTFGDTKEGMFGIRVASSMNVTRKTGGRITNAEGLVDEKAWGQASPWVDYVGPVHEKMVGIAVLNRPDSFRFPTTWHVRTYGLFAANPFGWHDFGKPERGDYTVPDGKSVTFGYRVILHAGDTKAAGIDRAFSAYAKPLVVEVVKQ